MGSEQEQLHVMFLPFMAPGHMMPMVEIARLLASYGIKSTVITTALNALLLESAFERETKSCNEAIKLLKLPFPTKEAGLPEGCENLTSSSTAEMNMKFLHALDLLRPRIEEALRLNHPHCIASDYLFPWTVDIAAELGIPRLAFNGSGLFHICVSDSLDQYKPHENVGGSETEPFVVPGLPDRVEMTRSQLPDIIKTKTEISPFFEKLKEAERRSFGVLVNSFQELEPGYADHFRTTSGTNAWPVGPISLFNRDKKRKGEKASVSEYSCLSWLDSKEPDSVLYVCFGSLTRFNNAQMMEIACALEDSGHSFIWVIGRSLKTDEDQKENELWSVDEFEEKAKKTGKGLIIRGWAPQVSILEHQATGGFLTHCGWNSILEGVSAGLPMVTWPLFADQFYNEKLVTQVLKLGVSVGNEEWKICATDESKLVERGKIKSAICAVMSGDDEAIEVRRRASRLRECAKKAVGEGGSSYNEVRALIDDIRSYKPSNGHRC